MPAPPGALAGPGQKGVTSVALGKGRIAQIGPESEARSLIQQGRYEEAERALRNLLAELEARPDHDPAQVAQTLGNLAVLFHTQARYEEAARFYQASIDATNRQWEGRNAARARYENRLKYSQLANVLYALSRLDEAKAMHELVLGIFEEELEKARERHASANDRRSCYRLLEAELDVGLGANNVAQVYLAKADYDRAEAAYRRALDIFIHVRGTTDHTDAALAYNNLALVAQAKRDYAGAEGLFLKSYQSFRNAHSGDHPDLVIVLRNLAALYSEQNLAEKALQSYTQAAEMVAGRMQQRAGPGQSSPLTAARNEIGWNRSLFDGLITAAMQVRAARPQKEAALAEQAFDASQWSSQAEAGAALLQMAARQSPRLAPDLAGLTRNRQDLLAEAETIEASLISSLSGAPEMRDATTEKGWRDRLAAIDRDIAGIDTRLAKEFPDYFSLVSAQPVSLLETRKLLRDNEALVLFHLTSGDAFAWAITADKLKWAKLDANADAIAKDVMTLRCGLDAEAWSTPQCAAVTGQRYTPGADAGKPLPFDPARAFRLYRTLLGQVEDVIKGKHLLIVPSGPLTQLPFQVLITTAPGGGAAPDWLIRRHALSVLPAVSSLKALRQVAHRSVATKPMIGFGNPLLDGDQTEPQYGAYFKELAQLARDTQSCKAANRQKTAERRAIARSLGRVDMKEGFADVDFLRLQSPLPETADELCTVARDVGADTGDIRLGDRAREREVKRLSEMGELAKYRVVHFATHGALAGQIKGNAEPGLLLTPPEKPSEEDDGYLTASEIAGLKLDADWVVLSACNTAAGSAQGAEALSGLARAFIYAQARALLVSHWEVNSDAAVKLITGAMRALTQDKAAGRAEAMRRSMLALIDKGADYETHPSYWAPLVVVGEGAASR